MPIFHIPDIYFVQDPDVGDALRIVQVLDFDICDQYLIIWFLVDIRQKGYLIFE